ncbi:quinone oxidoreductase family protein [Alkalimarinus alittae]|uniref:Zinc-binding alcohol dehydrogenase family protein n=1 Tax=Alkalimarinus alittae TaxID=2961619 RepID=A0ABY6MYB3_9ALTE|nr:zinc-binding alcohol dehydrogenase family protein [Alkalimarinus alittae]UZE94808.1 zinc-binding alcohol dehydrogenase family protein [Alkalimarinus alittae]
MQALQFTKTGSLDSLQVLDLPTPTPAADEVLVEVKATGVNPSDIKNVLGLFPYTTTPRIPGRDFAGVMVSGPKELQGKAVWGGTGKGFGFYQNGCHAQYVVMPANAVALLPESLTFAQAATYGVPFITAWDALERSQVKAGTRCLIIGAGAVARAAQALATARGANVVMAARRSDVLQTFQSEGISAIQLQDEHQLPVQAQDAFKQQAPEVIFDTTGYWLPAAVNTIDSFGRIAVISAPRDGSINLPILNLYRKGGSIIGVNSLLYSLENCARMLTKIGAAFENGLPVSNNFIEMPLSEAVAAYHQVSNGGSDKIVLIP